jgi:hypothetical protein
MTTDLAAVSKAHEAAERETSRLSTHHSKYTNDYDLALAIAFLVPCSQAQKGVHVPRTSPFQILLSKEEKTELERRANKYTLPYYQVVRAKMILLAHLGLSNDLIADRLAARREVVSMWRKRFFEQRLRGLDDRPRPGRPRVFPPRAGRSR